MPVLPLQPAWGINTTKHGHYGRNDSEYEEAIFFRRLSAEIAAHDPATQPLFVLYAAHLVHLSYQVRDSPRLLLLGFPPVPGTLVLLCPLSLMGTRSCHCRVDDWPGSSRRCRKITSTGSQRPAVGRSTTAPPRTTCG